MKFSTALIASVPAVALAQEIPDWHPPTAGDARSPCPMLNTLANHDILPHSGKDLTRENVLGALSGFLNFQEDFVTTLFEGALALVPDENATTFDLSHLNLHNGIEHDASLSRGDDFFGDNYVFNQTIFDKTRAFWTADEVTVQMMANARVARMVDSRAYNPEYTFTARSVQLASGESAFPFAVFGDMEAATFNREFVEYFFENERLPAELGWTVSETLVGLPEMGRIMGAVVAAENLRTDL